MVGKISLFAIGPVLSLVGAADRTGCLDGRDHQQGRRMKLRHALGMSAAFSLLTFASLDASAVACAEGVVRAGCVGPNGAVAVKKPVPVYRPPVTCAAGVYRAGCVGPNGAVVSKKPPPVIRPPVTCAAGVYRAGCVGPNGAAVVRR